MGLKVARHSGGMPLGDPALLRDEEDREDEAHVLNFVRDFLPGASRFIKARHRCMYTMTPDEHFIIDRHSMHPECGFRRGLLRHGFKFCPVVGEILADLVTEGVSRHPIGFLGLARFPN